jgi:hypothetical protein
MIAVSVPLPIVATQWALLVGLTLLVVMMYRQLAQMMFLSRASSSKGGLGIGDVVRPFDFWRGSSLDARSFETMDGLSIVMLSDPLCARCADALRQLEEFATRDAARDVRILVVAEVDAQQVLASPMLRNTSLDVARVESGGFLRVFKTQVTPFLYVLDRANTVLAKGPVTERGQIERMVTTSRRSPAVSSSSLEPAGGQIETRGGPLET